MDNYIFVVRQIPIKHLLYHVLGYFADRFDQYDQTSVNNMILINNLHFKSRKLTLIHTDENPHEKGFERQ